ncbi:glycosyltransferase family 2 protein [Methylobacterium sp. BTF04]|uniref:glycosyltransferase family 2 protein n=1 Tax=Methylobacterium sp. BTF04 TaxID=2708300 RepID=UPI0013D27F13|nr:glycosyltransferase [Methylobacterium sp. BTF04]NEU13481.1 glycosyltransferase family 2 protein [Methylobacterium sp. BTF04]
MTTDGAVSALAQSVSPGIVVIGRNEGERLRTCLNAVFPSADRIVYVDSGSTDDSVAIATRLGVSVLHLDMAQPFSAARARNEGFAALCRLAPGLTHVQFLDGDCELAVGWLATAVAFLADAPTVALVCGRRRERFPDRSIFNRLCDLEWDSAPGETLECGGDFLVRADAFAGVGGFDGGLIAGEEPELCVRLRARGWTIWRIADEMALHDAAMTRFSQWWRRMMRGGHAFAQVSRFHRRSEYGIWRTAIPRALFWGAGLPMLVLAGTFLHPGAALLALLYPAQICRIALRRGVRRPGSWSYACFTVMGKVPELCGMAMFYGNWLRGRSTGLIEYK